jgi:hypothetical protein
VTKSFAARTPSGTRNYSAPQHPDHADACDVPDGLPRSRGAFRERLPADVPSASSRRDDPLRTAPDCTSVRCSSRTIVSVPVANAKPIMTPLRRVGVIVSMPAGQTRLYAHFYNSQVGDRRVGRVAVHVTGGGAAASSLSSGLLPDLTDSTYWRSCTTGVVKDSPDCPRSTVVDVTVPIGGVTRPMQARP